MRNSSIVNILLGVIAQQRADYETAMKFLRQGAQSQFDTSAFYSRTSALACTSFINMGPSKQSGKRFASILLMYCRMLLREKFYVACSVINWRYSHLSRRWNYKIDAVEIYYERGLCLQELTMHQEALLDFGDTLHFAKRITCRWDVYILPAVSV